ncbi:MAG TPA: TonB-dependent receptor [Holophagaceae bacterium]|nr:TonB-dependent receptor [Holophagaceae bacterium]
MPRVRNLVPSLLAGSLLPLQAQEGLPDLKALMATKVVTASRAEEDMGSAPATVIVLQRADLEHRGYLQLSEVLDDLPGMDVVRPYGDNFVRSYWRGERGTIGEPFLLLLDGLVQNHLYFNTADGPLAALPLSNVERIEVVYGPASALYGANALRGVINVITVRNADQEGFAGRATLAAGRWDRKIADVNAFYKAGELRFSLTARSELGRLDSTSANRYELTKDSYFADRRIWGAFLDNPTYGGHHDSPWRTSAVDLRAFLGQLEVGFQQQELESGYGNEYPGDVAQNHAVWARPEQMAWMHLTRSFGPDLTGTTVLRRRESNVRNDSYFVYGYTDTSGGPRDGQRLVDFSYWQILSHSDLIQQDFDWQATARLAFAFGFSFERKDLQKAYDNPYGSESYASDLTSLGVYTFPAVPQASLIPGNRIQTNQEAFYGLARISLAPGHTLHLGLRDDRHSVYGNDTTLRLGYVGAAGNWTFKALYGEAVQEPTPRTLYGGWQGSGSDPTLRPQHSKTTELSAAWTESHLAFTASLWGARDRDVIVSRSPGSEGGPGAANLGQRRQAGFDLSAQALLPAPGPLKGFRAWAYFSRILQDRADRFTYVAPVLQKTAEGPVGDSATTKAWCGLSAEGDRFEGTLRARYMGPRATVPTNPIRRVPGYATLDLTLAAHWNNLTLQARVDNLLDRAYAHPGVRAADAGATPGTFDASGLHYSGGSQGTYSSLLEQPGRSFTLALRMAF